MTGENAVKPARISSNQLSATSLLQTDELATKRVFGVIMILFDLIKFFRHGGHVSHRTDLQWAVQIDTKLTKAYIIEKTLFTKLSYKQIKVTLAIT